MFKKGDIVYKPLYIEVDSSFQNVRYKEASFCGRDCDTNETTRIQGDDLVNKFVSSMDFESTEEATKTELARALTNAGPYPFTVIFTKSDGSDRELTGVLVEHEDLLGRSMVRDLRITKGSPIRTVDHRTLKSLVLNGVKYVLKD